MIYQVQHGFNVGGFFVWNVGEDDKVQTFIFISQLLSFLDLAKQQNAKILLRIFKNELFTETFHTNSIRKENLKDYFF